VRRQRVAPEFPVTGWDMASLGTPRTAARSGRSFGAAADAAPMTIVVLVVPPAVTLTVSHPLTP
jgi:hypothetical protein